MHDIRKYLIQCRSWSCFSVVINGCVCVWMCVELNMSARGCGGSSSSLPGTPGGEGGPANSVLSWAVSFEKLLEDPSGVSYFTVRHTCMLLSWFFRKFRNNKWCVYTLCMCVSPQAFLKSEVSAENILFWQACEKFRKIPATSLDEVWFAIHCAVMCFTQLKLPFYVFFLINTLYCKFPWNLFYII